MKKIIGLVLAIAILFGGAAAVSANDVTVASNDPGTGGH